MKRFSLLMIVISSLALSLSALSVELDCPRVIREKPTVLSDIASWLIVSEPGMRPVAEASIYLGAPHESAVQVPDASTIGNGIELISWNLVRTASDEFWLGCSYTGTSAKLFRKIAIEASECSVRYDLLPSGRRQRLRDVSCRR